jgi:transposase
MMSRQRQADAREAWLKACGTSSRVVRRAAAAGQAALRLSESTGPVEGHSNRLKLLKRRGYGRMQVVLLRQRVLYDAACPAAWNLRKNHCHLTIAAADLAGWYCPECFATTHTKRYDFDEVRLVDSGRVSYRCEACGSLITV